MKLARKVETAPKGIRGGKDFYRRKAAKVARTARILREQVLLETLVNLCLRVHPEESWVRTILGCLRLRGEQAMRPIRTMSAGERSKVALARLLLSGANVLLLDEPTNHFDIQAREAVEGTLTQFPGTILFVSHDRYFIETVGDTVLDLSPQRTD
jgi:ATPase subunit of ABC transporter with duplicated ATPase domains